MKGKGGGWGGRGQREGRGKGEGQEGRRKEGEGGRGRGLKRGQVLHFGLHVVLGLYKLPVDKARGLVVMMASGSRF